MKWFVSRDTGLSSESIVAFMEGVEPERGFSYPHDPSDLGRCLRLLELMPEYKPKMKAMRIVSPEWRTLIDHWEELSALYYEELPSSKAPKCYDRMRELLSQVGK